MKKTDKIPKRYRCLNRTLSGVDNRLKPVYHEEKTGWRDSMVGVYFSGTGNTKHCVERFASEIDSEAKCFSIEDTQSVSELARHDTIIFGFPVYYSNIPKIAKDFIAQNSECFRGKKVFIIATRASFNAGGIVNAARMFKSCGGSVAGSLQLNMPNNIGDMLITKLVFSKNYEKIIERADRKIAKAARRFRLNKPVRSGLSVFNYILSGILSWLWFYPTTDRCIHAPAVDKAKCSGCGLCERICPMSNISVVGGEVVSGENCTVCYRCFNRCPQKALTVLGRKAYDQYKILQ
ncbi:MAG: EFR1 family ferrodoxin [Oscillospiraceae bacterium]|nr:EFR1 family ferrodoxin [Oscillospiraceae bacterium]